MSNNTGVPYSVRCHEEGAYGGPIFEPKERMEALDTVIAVRLNREDRLAIIQFGDSNKPDTEISIEISPRLLYDFCFKVVAALMPIYGSSRDSL